MDGVQVFFLWSFANSVAFQIVASSLICFQRFRFFINSINRGKISKPTANVEIQKVNIGNKCEFINLI